MGSLSYVKFGFDRRRGWVQEPHGLKFGQNRCIVRFVTTQGKVRQELRDTVRNSTSTVRGEEPYTKLRK